MSSRLARHRKIVEPEVVGESDSEVEGEAWHVEREDTSEEEEEEVDDEVCAAEEPGLLLDCIFRNVGNYFCIVSSSPEF